jgi:hypothetical protein
MTDNGYRTELAELAACNPVPAESYASLAHELDWILQRLPFQEPPTLARSRRNIWIASLAVIVLVLAAGAALAASSWGPLAKIGTADHPASRKDALPPSILAQLKADQQPAGAGVDSIGIRLVNQARLLGTLPDRTAVYAVPTSKGKLCVLVATVAETCVDALSPTRPATLTILTPAPDKPTTIWGVAMDGVESISFTANGTAVTAPVHNNFYAWQNSLGTRRVHLAAATANFSDGSPVPLR